MSIEWINVKTRVPDDRRRVLAWGHSFTLGIHLSGRVGQFLGDTRFNAAPYGGRFDVENGGKFMTRIVTHWAEISGPTGQEATRTTRLPGQPIDDV